MSSTLPFFDDTNWVKTVHDFYQRKRVGCNLDFYSFQNYSKAFKRRVKLFFGTFLVRQRR
jgi:hypothetical protein